ncbi:methyl-accepting chemotaxis protein [Dongshaea marina]|uniref:methyl-accepting chemotaxis protein n=1 Tax=Dongshaea marina TaxID=2047966 RepID=UPI000D3EB501|nr:methyl-accepting chemotaxis protein [Dongshaea marina]
MIELLRKLTIAQRLYANIVIVAIGVIVISSYFLSVYHESLLNEKRAKTQELVESAYKVMEHFSSLSQKGEMSKEDAQNAAKEAIRVLRYGKNGYFWLNDSEPRSVMHPIKPAIEGTYVGDLQDKKGKYLYKEIVKAGQSSSAGGELDYYWTKSGASEPVLKVSFVKQFKPWDWFIGTGIYVEDVQAQFMSLVWTIVFDIVILLVILGLISAVIIRSIGLPLHGTIKALNDISEGEGDLTRRLDESGTDEISTLSHAFNRFVEKLQSMISDIHAASQKTVSESQLLSEIVGKNSTIAAQQNQETDGVATAMNEMSSTTQEVANNAQGAAQAANETSEQAVNGMAVVDQTIQLIGNLADELTETVGVSERLEQETQQIGSVLDVIRGIAEQTNLLALNAAIEAARAGEQGRGFAVVADEVRTLATRTQSSTNEIQEMIEKLQQMAKNVSAAMERTQQHSVASAEQAQLAGEALGQINEGITSINDMNTQIASAAEEQSLAANEINRNVTNIADLSNETVEQNTQTEQAAGDLRDVGEQLTELVGRFKF